MNFGYWLENLGVKYEDWKDIDLTGSGKGE